MSIRVARLLAFPAALLAFGLRLVEELWIRHLALELPVAVGVLVWVTAVIASLGLPWAAYARVTRGFRRRPAAVTLDPAGRMFVVGPTPRGMGFQAAWYGWVLAGVVSVGRVSGQDRARLLDLGSFTVVGFALVIASLALFLVLCAVDRPRLTLDPRAVTLHELLRSRSVGWDRRLPGSSEPADHPRPVVVDGLPHPHAPGREARGVEAAGQPAARRPDVPAALLRYYATYPAERSWIGTEEGLARLHVARRRAVSRT